MKETQSSAPTKSSSKELPAPQGIGMAVAFDWGLAVQILLTPIIAFFSQASSIKIPGLNPALSNVLLLIIACLMAGLLVFFGEMIRRGRYWARMIQLVANTLLSLIGLISLFNLYQSIRVGDFWPLVTEVILVIFSPLIVWRLSRSATARWFEAVDVAVARKRHGGRWIWFIALWALVGGVLQTLAAMHAMK